MSEVRDELLQQLESHYRSCGWKIRRVNGAVEASGPSGVTWIGKPVLPDDLASERFEAEIVELAGRRMPGGGELCPLDLLPAAGCEADLRDLMERLGLSGRPHVSIYSLAAAAAA